mgnify:CR=1 FL=1|jgi:transcriptional regulator with XRE-family HTH domain
MSKLKELREAKEMTQTDLAYLSGVSIGTIVRLEGAETEQALGHFRLDTLSKVAKTLGVRLRTVLPESG